MYCAISNNCPNLVFLDLNVVLPSGGKKMILGYRDLSSYMREAKCRVGQTQGIYIFLEQCSTTRTIHEGCLCKKLITMILKMNYCFKKKY
jgi:hypothetical protein